MRRIAELFSALERARSAEMQRAALMLAEAEQAILLKEAMRSDAKAVAHSALQRGDRMEWMLAESQFAFAGWNRERLVATRHQRNALHDAATERYRTSRVESEQMSHLLEDSNRQAEIIEGRKAQGVVDDRFLSRGLWLSMRKRNAESTMG